MLYLFTPFLFAQDYLYQEFGLNEGLPSSQVYSAYQDKNGVMWFATDRGLGSYNGYEFKQYGINEGLASIVVLDFYPQPDGKIFCATFDNKLFYFEADFKGFKPYPYNHVLAGQLSHRRTIKDVVFDPRGNLHVSLISGNGKLVIDKKGKLVQAEKAAIPTATLVNVAFEDYGGKLFYYPTKDLRVNPGARILPCEGCESGKIQLIRLPESKTTIVNNDFYLTIYSASGKKINSIKGKYRPITIKPISSNTFFVGYLFGGGCIMDTDGRILQSFLAGESVTRFIVDREDGYWFTTLYSGVFYVKEPSIRVFKGTENDTPIHALTTDHRGNLYVSYDTGKIVKIEPGLRASVYFDSGRLYKSFLSFDPTGKSLLYGGYEPPKNRGKNGKSIIPYILKFSEPSGMKTLASEIGQIRIITSPDTPDSYVPTNFRTHDACYWKDDIYAASPSGVYVKRPNDVFRSLATLDPLFGTRVDDIDYNELRNELYFASLGKGLIIYDKTNETIRNLTKKDGLFSNIINEIYIEGKDTIWACTNSGINRIVFTGQGYSISGLQSQDGLLNNGISDVEVLGDTVWIASTKGLVLAPKALFDATTKVPDYLLRMKSVLVNDRLVAIGSLLDLPYDRNRIEFNFTGMSLRSQGNLLYRYTLEGLDKKWYYTRNRKITYPSLPFGRYTLKLSVFANQGKNPQKCLEIPIVIHAPFWKTTWFAFVLTISMLAMGYLFFKFRILSYNKEMVRELLRLLIKKIRSRELYYVFRENGRHVRIRTATILYARSAGNYIEVVTEQKSYLVRCKIGDFIRNTPDPLEYLRIHRSYVIRIDKVESKSKTEVVLNGITLPVSQTYEPEISKLIF